MGGGGGSVVDSMCVLSAYVHIEYLLTSHPTLSPLYRYTSICSSTIHIQWKQMWVVLWMTKITSVLGTHHTQNWATWGKKARTTFSFTSKHWNKQQRKAIPNTNILWEQDVAKWSKLIDSRPLKNLKIGMRRGIIWWQDIYHIHYILT